MQKNLIQMLLRLGCAASFAWPVQAADEKLKWTFQNMEVKALLQTLAEIGQHNLIV
ncbi:MAG: Type pilus biosis and competence protein PilQ precursor, partial [Pseudomonadota bacterium]